MGNRSKDSIKAMIAKEMLSIYSRSEEIKQSINDELQETLEYLESLIVQIPQSKFGPLIAKTQKLTRKRGAQHIQTIPENDVVELVAEEEKESIASSRPKRRTSKRTLSNLKAQSSDEETNRSSKAQRSSRSKRKKNTTSSSDEEDRIPSKHSKLEKDVPSEDRTEKAIHADERNQLPIEESPIAEKSQNATMSIRRSARTISSQDKIERNSKIPNLPDDTLIAPTTDEMEEPSMYEDAIGKAAPIMNSTMNLNSTVTLNKLMNATVVLEPVQMVKLNETITINKKIGSSTESRRNRSVTKETDSEPSAARSRSKSLSKSTLQDRMQEIKDAMANKEFDELITDDESSPDIKKSKQNKNKKQEERKLQRHVPESLSSSEDEVLGTPAQKIKKQINAGTNQEIKNTYKSNALFSPYAKESVKKRVEAFEQAGFNSPNLSSEIQGTRMTRTKTRALAAAQAGISENEKAADKAVAQKLARKSIAKAMKISLAKQIKDTEEYKENKIQIMQKNQKIIPNEKANQKRQQQQLQQQKSTPLGKVKIQLPMSGNRIQYTPINQQITSNNKAFSASRANNIVTAVDSFLQPSKVISTFNSTEKLEERKRKLNDEDGRKKREEALRILTEEKRRKRQEKELKNKLAREAKEKQDMEKRQKAEREREEKARLAQQMIEKQREEIEKKRLAQLQRAQETEDRRKQEEQQRLQRLQEQEEAERLLAEQRRREQEAEKRKEAEAIRMNKNQMLAAQLKQANNKHQGPSNYILDSEPDEDESDDECRPKHAIPYWALSNVRKNQLAIQRFIPKEAIFKFFDTQKCTPNLSQMFHGIDRSRLKRTSSAIWKTPPRYSIMEIE